ncbi:MAG: restriction endonuclease subunit S [Gemmatimonadaceae bacterium]
MNRHPPPVAGNERTLPQGWRVVPLDDVATRGSGHTPNKKKPQYWDGGIKWVSLRDLSRLDQLLICDTVSTISEAGLRHSSAVLHPAQTVLLSRDATIGKVGIMEGDMAVSQHFITWRCGSQIDHEFLYYWLQSKRPEMERIASGSTIKTIGLSYFEKLSITLPSLPEQRSIAGVLKSLDSRIHLCEALLLAKRRFRAATMPGIMQDNGGTGRELAAERIPRNLGDVLRESREVGGSGTDARKLTIKLYGKGVIAKRDAREGSQNTQYYRRCAGQFIYSKLDYMNGACGIVPPELDGYESTLDLPAFDVSSDVNPRWLLHLLSWPGFYKQHLGLANGGRKARRVNPSQLLRVAIAFPPRHVQDDIADLLDAIDREIELLEQLAGVLARQKRALMTDLLSGALLVPLP